MNENDFEFTNQVEATAKDSSPPYSIKWIQAEAIEKWMSVPSPKQLSAERLK